jgi:hypothetical protein
MVTLRPATSTEAKAWFAQYHYTGTAAGHRFYSWLRDGGTDGIVAFGRGGNRFGVGDKFGLGAWRGGLEITRVACHPDAPRNTASKMVAAALRELAADGEQWVFTYADTAHGHHGGIYQALNAVYVGTDAKQWVNFELDGLRISKRAVSGRFGHTRWPEVRDLAAAEGRVLRKVAWQPKHTYVLPISADKKVRRAIQAALQPLGLPYPKPGRPVVPTPYRNRRPKADQ